MSDQALRDAIKRFSALASSPCGTRHTRCLKHGVWWIWSEVIYKNEYLWAARHSLQCYA